MWYIYIYICVCVCINIYICIQTICIYRCCPSVTSWFINAINYRYISALNHCYWSYKPT